MMVSLLSNNWNKIVFFSRLKERYLNTDVA